MSEGTSIPPIATRLLDLIANRVGSSAKVLDSTPVQPVDMLASAGHPSVIYLSPSIDITYSVEVMNAGELRMNERFVLGIVCEVSAQAANITLDDARHRCAELMYAVLTVVARNPGFGMLDDDQEHQYFETIPISGTYIHGSIGDSAIAVGVRHEVVLRCNNRLILTK